MTAAFNAQRSTSNVQRSIGRIALLLVLVLLLVLLLIINLWLLFDGSVDSRGCWILDTGSGLVIAVLAASLA